MIENHLHWLELHGAENVVAFFNGNPSTHPTATKCKESSRPLLSPHAPLFMLIHFCQTINNDYGSETIIMDFWKYNYRIRQEALPLPAAASARRCEGGTADGIAVADQTRASMALLASRVPDMEDDHVVPHALLVVQKLCCNGRSLRRMKCPEAIAAAGNDAEVLVTP
jgi:hypothetical protein